MEWLLYVSGLISPDRYATLFNADGRFADCPSDIALTAARILTEPAKHRGQTYTVTGPVEYSHDELATEFSRVLDVGLPFEQVTVTTFLELIGQSDDTAKLKQFEAVTIDQQEGRLAGITDAAQRILGQPLVTVEEFINQHHSLFDSAT
ncbi:MAG: hypothetical protein QOI33_246 [Mycobacterium sp.]|jgi:uncharacterized protein YbjT (DUF2867 family)|nr:hypothetical protein [Mycobacterium sp.]